MLIGMLGNILSSDILMEGCGKMNYIEETLLEIKNAKTDEEIKSVMYDIYITTQWDSAIRKEFDDYFEDVKQEKVINQ